MPPVSASGFLSERLLGIETLLANCATWQTWTGEVTAAAAKNHIYIPSNESPSTSDKPFAIINDGDIVANRFADVAYTVQSDYFILIINEPASGLTTDRDIYLDTLNKIGGIIQEMQALQSTDNGTTQFVNITSISKLAGPLFRSNVEEAQGQNYQITTIGLDIGL